MLVAWCGVLKSITVGGRSWGGRTQLSWDGGMVWTKMLSPVPGLPNILTSLQSLAPNREPMPSTTCCGGGYIGGYASSGKIRSQSEAYRGNAARTRGTLVPNGWNDGRKCGQSRRLSGCSRTEMSAGDRKVGMGVD